MEGWCTNKRREVGRGERGTTAPQQEKHPKSIVVLEKRLIKLDPFGVHF